MEGKVIEVFIPKQYKNGNLLDIMNRTLIGFKVETENGMKEVIQEQDEFNVEIRKGDTVLVTEQIIGGKEYIDIEKVGE